MSRLFPKSEEWIELQSDPDYLISTAGRVYDLQRKAFRPLTERSWADTPGSLFMGCSVRPLRGGSSTNRYISVAREVLTSFVGPGRVPVYLDGDYRNVSLSNLEWAAPAKSVAKPRRVG